MAKYVWEKLPDRGPRGSPQNYDRVFLLAASRRARIGKDGWEVQILKKEVKRNVSGMDKG